MKDELKMGIRSLAYRRKQYVSLFLVCMFGISISLFCLFIIKGMLNSLEAKAKIYYGGDFQFMGERSSMWQNNKAVTFPALESVFPEGTVISERFNLDADTSAYYFEGTGVRQRVLKGVYFDNEQSLFETFNYVEGSAKDIPHGSSGVLLSQPIAEMLEVHVGDEITFMLKTHKGYINTVPLNVKGIFKDSSLFGMYTSYMDKDYLLKAYDIDGKWFNRVSIILPDGTPSKKQVQYYQSELEKLLPMYPQVNDKKIFYDDRPNLTWPCYALVTLSANLEDVQILIDAMSFISGFVIIMLVIIIVAGVSSTFRVIVMKRINEIGIYKAIGMKRHKIMGMLLTETFLLLITGCVSGFVFSLILCKLASLFNLSFIPAFDIFLSNGRLSPIINLVYVLVVCAVVCVTTLIGVMFSVRKSVSITPCEALAITE